jgi:hypothetical protein
VEIVAVAVAEPAAACFLSSTPSLALGAAGTCSSSTAPPPAAIVAGSAVASTPKIKSPLAVVVVAGEAKDALFPSAAAGVPSRELEVATPEYSKIANRKVPPVNVSDTVTVLAPAAMFSA